MGENDYMWTEGGSKDELEEAGMVCGWWWWWWSRMRMDWNAKSVVW